MKKTTTISFVYVLILSLVAREGIAAVTDCGTAFSYTNSISIPQNAPSGITTPITVSGISGTNLGTDVFLTKVHIEGLHTWVGDLIITLTAPNGKSVMLTNRPGVPNAIAGCEYDDFSYDVITGTGHDNELFCDLTPTPPLPPGTYAISGVFTAIYGYDVDSINIGAGNPNGTWSLFASDNAALDVGSIDTLKLYFASSTFTYVVNGGMVNFTAPTVAGATFAWNFGDSQTSTGSTPVHTYAGNGSYTVTMTTMTSTDTCRILRQVNAGATLGIGALQDASKFVVAPNPASGIVEISISDLESGNAELAIYDLVGRELMKEQIISNSYHRTLSVSDWNRGIYFVKVSGDRFAKVQKLILD